MATFVNALGQVVSSNVLGPSDCAVGDVLVDATAGTASIIAQNVTTGAPVAVSLAGGAPASVDALTTTVIKASAVVAANRFCTLSGSNLAKNTSVQGGEICGVATAGAAIGAPIPLVFLGLATVESGGLINAGDKLASDANGRAIQATALAVNGAGPALLGSQVVASALGSAIGPGVLVPVLVWGAFGVAPATTT